jgi:hypothetical protein
LRAGEEATAGIDRRAHFAASCGVNSPAAADLEISVAVFIHKFEFVLAKMEVSRYAMATSIERGADRICLFGVGRRFAERSRTGIRALWHAKVRHSLLDDQTKMHGSRARPPVNNRLDTESRVTDRREAMQRLQGWSRSVFLGGTRALNIDWSGCWSKTRRGFVKNRPRGRSGIGAQFASFNFRNALICARVSSVRVSSG